jgi:hypothetical protein
MTLSGQGLSAEVRGVSRRADSRQEAGPEAVKSPGAPFATAGHPLPALKRPPANPLAETASHFASQAPELDRLLGGLEALKNVGLCE